MVISSKDLQHVFSGEMESVRFLDNGNLYKVNAQSCDCDRVLIKMKNQETFLSLESAKGVFDIHELSSFDPAAFSMQHIPPEDAHISFVRAEVDEYGIEGIKFRYRDRYIFFFADEGGWVITTINQWDLFEDDDAPMPDYDDSVLALER